MTRAMRSRLELRDGAVPIVMYTRAGCGLCAEMEAVVRETLRRGSFPLTLVDVDGDRELQDRYGLVLPVLEIGGEVAFETRVRPSELSERVEAWRSEVLRTRRETPAREDR